MTVRQGAIRDSTTGRKDWHSYSKIEIGVGGKKKKKSFHDLPGMKR